MKVLKKVEWLGDSKEVLSGFPGEIKSSMGFQLNILQKGEMPLRSRPMKSIGRGVYELKEQDEAGWYRTVYTIHVKGCIYVLHAFKKQSAKTSKADLEITKSRLKQIRSL